jgi:hypothetical protein
MEDFCYIDEDGTRIPSGTLSTAQIQDLLAGGIQLIEPKEHESVELVMLRLRLELEERGA